MEQYFDQKFDEYYSKMLLDSTNKYVWTYCALSAWMLSSGETNLVIANIKENVNWIKKSWNANECPCSDVIVEKYWIKE